MTSISEIHDTMTPKERTEYVAARTRDLAFDAVHKLWCKREAGGMTLAELSMAMDCDEAWVSRNLKAPGNWTLRTLARFVAGLEGEIEILVHDLNEPMHGTSNYDAYRDYLTEPGPTRTSNASLQRISGSPTGTMAAGILTASWQVKGR